MRAASAVVVLVLIGAACSPTAKPSAGSSSTASTLVTSAVAVTAASDQSAIVAVAATQRLRSGSAGVSKSRINIVERFGRFISGGLVVPDSAGELIDDQTRLAVEHAVAPGVVTWVDSVDSVTDNGALSAQDVGVVLTITPPTINGTSAEVGTALWCGNVCGEGSTYLLERSGPDGWRVTGSRDEFVA
jgi:hypothetical protein